MCVMYVFALLCYIGFIVSIVHGDGVWRMVQWGPCGVHYHIKLQATWFGWMDTLNKILFMVKRNWHPNAFIADDEKVEIYSLR
jgi:hypothetical protein